MTLIGETTPYYVKGETGAPVGQVHNGIAHLNTNALRGLHSYVVRPRDRRSQIL
jgi:hypothetical protein